MSSIELGAILIADWRLTEPLLSDILTIMVPETSRDISTSPSVSRYRPDAIRLLAVYGDPHGFREAPVASMDRHLFRDFKR